MLAPGPDIRREVRRDAGSGLVGAMQAFAASLKHALLEVRGVLQLFSASGRWSRAAAAALGE